MLASLPGVLGRSHHAVLTTPVWFLYAVSATVACDARSFPKVAIREPRSKAISWQAGAVSLLVTDVSGL